MEWVVIPCERQNEQVGGKCEAFHQEAAKGRLRGHVGFVRSGRAVELLRVMERFDWQQVRLRGALPVRSSH